MSVSTSTSGSRRPLTLIPLTKTLIQPVGLRFATEASVLVRAAVVRRRQRHALAAAQARARPIPRGAGDHRVADPPAVTVAQGSARISPFRHPPVVLRPQV